jgi:hypothetical protein
MTVSKDESKNPIRAKEAGANKSKRHRTLSQKWRLLTLANKLIVIATIAIADSMYTWIALKTLREIQNGSSDTQHLAASANKEAEKAETISANVDKSVTQIDRIARAAEMSLNANITASRLDERAWIEIAPMKPLDVVAGPYTSFSYNLIPKNVGKTAARKIVVRVVPLLLGTIQQTKSASFIHHWQEEILLGKGRGKRVGIPVFLPNSQRREQEVLGPGEAFPVPIVLGGSAPSTNQQNSPVVSEIIGRIDYLDEFGIQHWLGFCFYTAKL